MGNKIIVEFDRKKLKKMCPLTDWCKSCNKEDEQLLECHINRAEYKIKEQDNSFRVTHCVECKKYNICELRKRDLNVALNDGIGSCALFEKESK